MHGKFVKRVIHFIFYAMKQLQEAMKKADENTRMKQDKVRS